MWMYQEFGKRVLKFALRLFITIAVMVILATNAH